MQSSKFEFINDQGTRLAGKLDLPDGPALAYALFAHCFTCTKDSVAASRISRALARQGIGVLRFDFTGLGQSEGDFADSTFGGTVQDLLSAAAAMTGAGMTPQLLVGHSLGGSAVLAAAGSLPSVAAVATIGAPFDVQYVTRLLGASLPVLLSAGEGEVNLGGRPFRMRAEFVRDLARHDQAVRIEKLDAALLVMHAPMDTVVNVSNATGIFQAAKHPKSFVSLDDADHLLTRASDAEYAATVISAWATRYLGAATVRNASEPGLVVVQGTGVGDFQVEINAGPSRLLSDEPVEVGGMGSGLTPYELVSAGLGACTAMTLRMYARRKNWPLEDVRVCVGHGKDADPTRPDVFVREIALKGPLDSEQHARLVEIAEKCPVHRSLERGARVVTREVRELGVLGDVEQAGEHASDMAKSLPGA